MAGNRTGIAALLLSAAMMNIAYTMLVPLVPVLTGRFQLSAVEVAAAFSGFALAKALAQPVGGVLVDRVRRASLLGLVGLGLTAATIVGLAFADAGWQVLVWRLAWGVAEGLTMPVLYQLASVLGASSTYGTTKVMGWFGGSCTAGMVLGPAVVGVLHPFLGFTGVFLAGAAVTAGGGVLLFAMLPGAATTPAAEPAAPGPAGSRTSAIGVLAVLVGLFAAIDLINNALFATLEPVLPLHLDRLTGNGIGYTSVLFTIALAVFMIGTVTCARLIESRPLLVVATAAFGAEAVGLAVMGLTGGIVALCAGLLVFMTAQPVLYMVARRGVNLVPRHQLGRAFGAFGLVSDIGFIAGPLLGALIYSRIGTGAFLVMAGVAGVAAVGALLLRRTPDRLLRGIRPDEPVPSVREAA
jgi:DHA1 family multidrug resistance protein-like MFS transporter